MRDERDAAEAVELAIVGAGPCGLATAVAAKRSGLRHLVFDRGCVTESITHYPYYMTFFSTAERLEIGDVPFTIPDAKPTRREALSYYRRVVAHHGLHVRQYEEVTAISGRRGQFIVHVRTRQGREKRVQARGIVIATGGFGNPNRLALEGGDPERRVIYGYREPYPFFDQDVTVVGGGNSAVETALELYRNGTRVRMVHLAGVFDRGVKPWVRPDIDNRIASGEIPMHWRSRVVRVGGGTVTIATVEEGESGSGSALLVHGTSGDGSDNNSGDPGQESAAKAVGERAEFRCDQVLAMTGWRPDRTLLHGLGVRTDPETGIPDHRPETMETNVAGVYIAGVLAAGFDANKIFIENGRNHGQLIVAAVTSPPEVR